jgi:YfiH family protein
MEFYQTKQNITIGYAIAKTTNREKELKNIAHKLNFKNYFFANQIHSNKIIVVGENKVKSDADAIICTQKGTLVGVFTADCVPITIYKENFVGIIHAGWKGFAKNIFTSFFNFIPDRERKSLKAIIGPCICKNCYEVSHNVAVYFKYAKKQSNNKFLVDLSKEAVYRLTKHDISQNNIQQSNLCTYCSCHNFPSYRKDKTDLRIVNFAGI